MTESSGTNTDMVQRIQDVNCSAKELDALIGFSPESDRLIAAHTNTGAETLKKLSNSTDDLTREFVVSNPNSSIDVLLALADDFPKGFVLNPAFDILIMEDPRVLERLYESTLAKILAQKECPQSIVIPDSR